MAKKQKKKIPVKLYRATSGKFTPVKASGIPVERVKRPGFQVKVTDLSIEEDVIISVQKKDRHLLPKHIRES